MRHGVVELRPSGSTVTRKDPIVGKRPASLQRSGPTVESLLANEGCTSL